MDHGSRKVTASHLRRSAFVYVRQSTLRQVTENQESTRRQYGLRERATALGFAPDQIVVIDSDLGQSGASSDREGFQRLVAEVGLGHVGIVLGLEVSRLARSSTDWHRLLEICALSDTLILDEDGLYDPTDFNDRLLLGLKGTMSEAELHMLRARLRGGLLAKARRGELRLRLPVGLVYDPLGRVMLHPDVQVRETVRLLFQTFSRIGTACGTVKYFSEQRIPFPSPARAGISDEVVFGQLQVARAVQMLHNPRYAGAFAYGRRQERRMPEGRSRSIALPREQWEVLLIDAHPGYITWEEHERIQGQLESTARAYGSERRHGPPREGPALLQGLAVCGRCGGSMSPRYQRRRGQLAPTYICARSTEYRERACQVIAGGGVDSAMSQLLLESVSPHALALVLAVHSELEARAMQIERLRDQQIERAEHEAEHARLRYMAVDATNRLVAGSLEAAWDEKLRALDDIRLRIERERESDRTTLDDATKRRIRALAEDIPSVWSDPAVPHRERKRIMTLLVADVTLTRDDETQQIVIGVRFRGGATTTMRIPAAKSGWQLRQTDADVLARVVALLKMHPIPEVASMLNAEGRTTGAGAPFTKTSVHWLMHRWGFKSCRQHLRESGYLTAKALAALLGRSKTWVRDARRQGGVRACRYNRRDHLYAPIAEQPPSIQARAARHAAGRANRRSDTLTAGGAV
jgi:DNA invertase Pin-like site-specific DNA recombinase